MATSLNELANVGRELANALFTNDEEGLACVNQRTVAGVRAPGQSCLQRAEERKLTREEKSMGWTRRPFNAYDPRLMCSSCRAYWFAEMAAQELHMIRCLEAKLACRKPAVVS
jgi:hypothetical protein